MRVAAFYPWLDGYPQIWEERARHLVDFSLVEGPSGMPGMLCDLHVESVLRAYDDLAEWFYITGAAGAPEDHLYDYAANLLWGRADVWLWGNE